jgi:hypothetical protein
MKNASILLLGTHYDIWREKAISQIENIETPADLSLGTISGGFCSPANWDSLLVYAKQLMVWVEKSDAIVWHSPNDNNQILSDQEAIAANDLLISLLYAKTCNKIIKVVVPRNSFLHRVSQTYAGKDLDAIILVDSLEVAISSAVKSIITEAQLNNQMKIGW